MEVSQTFHSLQMMGLTWKEQAEGQGTRHDVSKPTDVLKGAITLPYHPSLPQAPNIFSLQGETRNPLVVSLC